MYSRQKKKQLSQMENLRFQRYEEPKKSGKYVGKAEQTFAV